MASTVPSRRLAAYSFILGLSGLALLLYDHFFLAEQLREVHKCPPRGSEVEKAESVQSEAAGAGVYVEKSPGNTASGKNGPKPGDGGADQRNFPPDDFGPVVASRNGKVFHRPDCAAAKRIKKENRLIFNNVGEAREKGYRPARNCFKADR